MFCLPLPPNTLQSRRKTANHQVEENYFSSTNLPLATKFSRKLCDGLGYRLPLHNVSVENFLENFIPT